MKKRILLTVCILDYLGILRRVLFLLEWYPWFIDKNKLPNVFLEGDTYRRLVVLAIEVVLLPILFLVYRYVRNREEDGNQKQNLPIDYVKLYQENAKKPD